ncbi:hypothetical protein [Larkinella sp. C7]|jgi:hypothetical protein|uniref:hypothetical protein n=1 Tax=Larkinella sp. C7 TaxID=2576607 RepID=UPI0011113845|nr:hypothetical protein [Larkinella sp. C7]
MTTSIAFQAAGLLFGSALTSSTGLAIFLTWWDSLKLEKQTRILKRLRSLRLWVQDSLILLAGGLAALLFCVALAYFTR